MIDDNAMLPVGFDFLRSPTRRQQHYQRRFDSETDLTHDTQTTKWVLRLTKTTSAEATTHKTSIEDFASVKCSRS